MEKEEEKSNNLNRSDNNPSRNHTLIENDKERIREKDNELNRSNPLNFLPELLKKLPIEDLSKKGLDKLLNKKIENNNMCEIHIKAPSEVILKLIKK